MASHENKKKVQGEPGSEEDPRLTTCGIGRWRPPWLQVLNNPIIFLVNISLIGIIQSMAGSLIYSTMNTLEKRYAFDSKISAVISIADNISSMVLGPLIGYYGIRFNRSRLIGMGELLIALSCFLQALPYFIYGPATHFIENELGIMSKFTSTSKNESRNFQMCIAGESEDCLDNRGSTVWPAVFCFFVGNFIRGVGFTIYYVIALPFMDDNVSKKNSPIFLACMQCIMLIGPAFGFVFSAFCLRLYEDPWNDPGLNLNDPRFIGAWWMGFLLVGILLITASVPLFFYPTQFKNAPVKAAVIKKKMKESGGTLEAAKRFFKNPLIVLFFLGNTTRYFGIMGYYMFNVKYIESQYRRSSSSASMFIGSASLVPIAIGILAGGIFISKCKPRARIFFTFLFLVEFVTVFTLGSGLIFGCDPIKLAGVPTADGTYELQSTCNQECPCTTRVFTPICELKSETTYFSPCYAGCSAFDSVNSTFERCSCSPTTRAAKGYCPNDVSKCDSKLYTYMIILISGMVVSSTSKTGNMLINYRAVDPMDKSFAAGLISTLVSLCSFIPSPLVYGYLADSSCLIWEKKCGKKGNCWLYDQVKFRNLLHLVTIGFLILGSLFDFLMIFFADRLKNLYDDEEDGQGDNALELTKKIEEAPK